MIEVTVKFFGTASTCFGGEPKQVELPEGASVADLLEAVVQQQGSGVGNFLQKATFVVNHSRADRSTLLNNGDEVMIMFTLGGG